MKKGIIMCLTALSLLAFVGCNKDENNANNVTNNVNNGGNAVPEGWVDLGLPSGLLWAKCNVGADAPEEYGDPVREENVIYWYDDHGYGRCPTKEEWEELLNNTTIDWTIRNGVRGFRFTADNNNSIFLPFEQGYYDHYNYYWSSSHVNNDENDWYYVLALNSISPQSVYISISEYVFFPIRAVRSAR